MAEVGALAFGLVIGWYTYSVIRNRADAVGLADLASVVAAVGGGAVTSLFSSDVDLFGWYGVGLAVGFFGYFLVLLVLIRKNNGRGWSTAYFLDGRRPMLDSGDERVCGTRYGTARSGERPPEMPR